MQRGGLEVPTYHTEVRQQIFGMMSKAFVRTIDVPTQVEIARCDLPAGAVVETAMISGERCRHVGEGKFKAVGRGFTGGHGPQVVNTTKPFNGYNQNNHVKRRTDGSIAK